MTAFHEHFDREPDHEILFLDVMMTDGFAPACYLRYTSDNVRGTIETDLEYIYDEESNTSYFRADWEAAWDAEVKAGGDPAFIGMLTWEQLEALCAAA